MALRVINAVVTTITLVWLYQSKISDLKNLYFTCLINYNFTREILK